MVAQIANNDKRQLSANFSDFEDEEDDKSKEYLVIDKEATVEEKLPVLAAPRCMGRPKTNRAWWWPR